MTYGDKIDVGFSEHALSAGSFDVFADHVIGRAFISKEIIAPEDFRRNVGANFDLDALHLVDQDLLRSRVIGGAVTRMALGSYGLYEKRVISEPFISLSLDDQDEITTELMVNYGKQASRYLDDTGLAPTDLLSERGMAVLPHIPHDFVRHQLHAMKAHALAKKERLRNVAAYVNVLPGTFPPKDYADRGVGVNDSILVQAFGRNGIADKELPFVRDLALRHTDERIVFEHLERQDFDPGESNYTLADAVDHELVAGVVVEPILQWEVAYALWKNDPVNYDLYRNYMHVLWPHSDFYPTYEVKRDSIEVMDRFGIYNPLELAHPDMMIRALGILARQGVEADILAIDVPFDKRSVQAQTRSEGPWMVRETLTRVEHVLRGRVKY